MTLLLSWHGTLLCRERDGTLVHRPIGAPGTAQPVEIDLAWDALRGDGDRLARTGGEPIQAELPEGPLAGFALVIDARRRWLALKRNGTYLAAERGMTVATDRTQIREWERFLPLTPGDTAVLRLLLGRAWVRRSTLALLAPGEIRLSEGHRLEVGSLSVELSHQVPFDIAGAPLRATLLVDGWRIDQLCLYEPLIYSSAARKMAAHQQLWLNLQSLTEVARYRGRVHVITDRPRDELLRNAPLLDPAQLSVQRSAASDRVGAIAAKFSIVDWPDAAAFQPVLFVDADTIFDADPAPILATLAASDRISAPIEDFSPMRVAPSTGATLLASDGINPQAAHGFNSGTLGIPNLVQHGHTLRLIRRIILNRADLLGRNSFSWVDQPVANYVSHRLAHVDTHLINRFVRYGYPGIEDDPGARRGLVHFWPPMTDEAKLSAMTAYLNTLRKVQPQHDTPRR